MYDAETAALSYLEFSLEYFTLRLKTILNSYDISVVIPSKRAVRGLKSMS